MKKQITISSFNLTRIVVAGMSIGCGIGFLLGMFLGVLDRIAG